MLRDRSPQKSASFFARSAAILTLVVFAHADRCFGFELGYGAYYGILTESSSSLSITGSGNTVWGDIGIGPGGTVSGTGSGTVNGHVNFSDSSGTFPGSMTLNPNSGNPVFNVGNISTGNPTPGAENALGTLNALSSTLGVEAGQNVKFGSGVGDTLSVNVSSGTPDGNGNNVFTVTSLADFTAGQTLTITGTPSEFVVFNVSATVAGTGGLNGAIELVGIDTDHVLFNYLGGTMTIDTTGVRTHGTFLDPTGNFAVSGSKIDGRIIGGGASTFDGSVIAAPEPSGLGLAALGILCLAAWRRVTRRAA